MQHNFSQNGVILHACVHGRRKELFLGASLVDFSKSFPLGVKRGEICFLPLKIKKRAIFTEIFKFLPLFRHPYDCVSETFVPHH